MERDTYVKYMYPCYQRKALVDQYMVPVTDTRRRLCYGQLINPIYDTQGNVNFTTPLSQYKNIPQQK